MKKLEMALKSSIFVTSFQKGKLPYIYKSYNRCGLDNTTKVGTNKSKYSVNEGISKRDLLHGYRR